MIYITSKKSFFYSELCMNFSVTSDPPLTSSPVTSPLWSASHFRAGSSASSISSLSIDSCIPRCQRQILFFCLVKKTEKCQRTWRSGGKNEKSYILLKIEMINFMSWYMYILFNSAMYCHVQVCKMWWRWKPNIPTKHCWNIHKARLNE